MNPGFNKILDEYHQLTEQLSSGGSVDLAKLGRRQAELLPVVEKIQTIQKLDEELIGNQQLAEGGDDVDEEMRNMALEEIRSIEGRILELSEEIETDLIPKDEYYQKNAILEMRAGAGGDEAGLFAAELFRAYSKFAEGNNWKVNVVSSSTNDAGGYKEVIFEITGKATAGANGDIGPYGIFKYESGVHRVQRVPETEKSGRVHTSTITVAVMPELEENDYSIDPKDLRIEATTSQGAGGQSVNTTYSAIRVVHIPTGIMATCQDERSQSQNKEKALAVIRARVSSYYREIEEKKLSDNKRSPIGTGDRSEKIRTYNFPQDRVTDHRINQNFNQINLIMEGELNGIIEALQKADIELKREAIKNS